jgi:hypothetical protein
MQFFKTLSAKARLAVVAGTTLMAAGILAAPAWAASTTTTVQLSARSLAADAGGPAVVVGKVIPAVSDIKVETCSSKNETWVHITTEDLGKKKTLCYGGRGTMPFSENNTVSVCAGNNYGYLRYSDPHHGAQTWQFAPGHGISWTYGVSVDYLTISNWSGSHRC